MLECSCIAMLALNIKKGDMESHSPKSTSLRVHIDLLTTWHNGAHAKRSMSTGEVRLDALGALLDVVWAVRRSVLADPDLLTVGRQRLEMDW